MTRLMLMTFFGDKRWKEGVHPHESPKVMTFPLIVLAALSVLGGLMLLDDWIVDFLAPVTGTPEHVEPPIPTLAVSVLVLAVVAVGVAVAWFLVGKREVSREAPTDVSFVTRAARADLYGDAINDTLVVEPGRGARSRPDLVRQAGCRRAWSRVARRGRRVRRDPAAHPERLRPLLCPVPARRRAPRRPRAPGGELLMNDFPWLTVLIVVPLVGAVVTAAMPYEGNKARPKQISLGFGVLTLVLAAVMASQYDADAGMQFTETHQWINVFGVHYAVGVDGLALVMVLLTVLLVPIVIGASWYDADHGNTKAFFAWALALEAASIGVFAATDVFLFYVVFEATLIPGYFLIGGFGREGRQRAAVKFLMFQLVGGLVMLAAVVGLYVVTANAGHPTYLMSELSHITHRPGHAEVAVRRLLLRLRGQGADVPGAHLAGRHDRERHRRHERAAGVHPRQDRHLRDAALLPRAVPRRLALGDAGRGHAGADLDRLRRHGRGRPGRHAAADRSDLAEPLRPHRARHLRVHQPGHVRLDPLHGQPRGRHGCAVPGRRLPGQAAGHGLDLRDHRRREDRTGAGRASSCSRAWRCWACPGSRSSSPRSW